MFSTAPEPLHAVVDADDMRASMVLSTTQPSNYPSLNNNSVNNRSQTTPRRIQYESNYQLSSNMNNNSASTAANFFNSTLPQSHRKKKPITMEHIPHFTSPQSHSIGNNNNNNDDQPLFLTQESYEPRPSQIVGFNSTDFDPSLATDGMNDFEMQNFVNNDMDLDPELDDDNNGNNNNNDNDNDNDSVTEEETDDGIPIIQTAVSQKQLPSSHGVSINNDIENNVYNNYDDEDDDTFEDSQRPIGGKVNYSVKFKLNINLYFIFRNSNHYGTIRRGYLFMYSKENVKIEKNIKRESISYKEEKMNLYKIKNLISILLNL